MAPNRCAGNRRSRQRVQDAPVTYLRMVSGGANRPPRRPREFAHPDAQFRRILETTQFSGLRGKSQSDSGGNPESQRLRGALSWFDVAGGFTRDAAAQQKKGQRKTTYVQANVHVSSCETHSDKKILTNERNGFLLQCDRTKPSSAHRPPVALAAVTRVRRVARKSARAVLFT